MTKIYFHPDVSDEERERMIEKVEQAKYDAAQTKSEDHPLLISLNYEDWVFSLNTALDSGYGADVESWVRHLIKRERASM